MSSVAAPALELPRRQFWIGFFLAGLGSILFSAKAIVAKLTYAYGVDALVVIGFRMLLALPFFLVIALWQAWQAKQGKQVKLTWRQRWLVLLLGFLGYYLASLLNFIGLQYISANLERLILFLSPTFVLIFSAIFLKKPILPKQWLALALSYLGVGLVFMQDLNLTGDDVVLGAACVLGSVLSYSAYLISSGELLRRIGSTRLVAYAMSTSAVYTLLHFFLVYGWAGLEQPAGVYGLSLLHAVFHTVAPTFMIMWAVERIGAPMTSQLGLLGPVSIPFLAYWFLGEPITLIQVCGTLLVLTGAIVLSRR